MTASRPDADPLVRLRDHFRSTSTTSMPIVGVAYWAIVAVCGRLLPDAATAYVVLFGSGMIFPVAALLDRARGRRVTAGGTDNPVMRLFLSGLALVVLMWPLVIIAARAAEEPVLIVLGGAILMALVWIPYGWAGDDSIGLRHAVGRVVGCYAACLRAPDGWRVTAIALVTLAAYAYTLATIRRPGPVGAAPAVG